MKKLILVLLGTAGLATAGHAQGVKLGVKAGVNLANYGGDGKKLIEDTFGTDVKSLVGFHGGVMLNAPLSSDGFFAIQPELLYSQKGGRLEEDGDKITFRQSYLDLPVLARINAGGFIFELGPQASLLLSSKTKVEVGGQSNEESDTDGMNKFQVGYAAGVGYQLSSGPNFTIRYNGNFTSIDEDSDKDSKITHQVFQFSVGYLFGGK
ncbi:PorT family protein [Hymenobacter sp. HSC-4F20]|uniref:porin family protein n=1 Tax=Hymenobacter sp. HSC-4F20 TaxID=2864135 RepID=UPI001C72E35A|nr:porin family protein [Hymenobacter sp. HSC-4F20]MBX0292852.1 PorT family protein [Hymenobacter sp. HSC-4F20]